MRKFTDETRRRLATGWNPRVCTAGEYARQNGVSERTLRGWRARLPRDEGSAVPAGNAAVPLQAAVDALQARLEELEGAVDAARAAVAAARAAFDACRLVPGGTDLHGDGGGENKHQANDAGPGAPPEAVESLDAHDAVRHEQPVMVELIPTSQPVGARVQCGRLRSFFSDFQ